MSISQKVHKGVCLVERAEFVLLEFAGDNGKFEHLPGPGRRKRFLSRKRLMINGMTLDELRQTINVMARRHGLSVPFGVFVDAAARLASYQQTRRLQ